MPVRLLGVGAPEAQCWVGVDCLPGAAGRDPVGSAGLDGHGPLADPVAIVVADGVQLLIVASAPRMIYVEPGAPFSVVFTGGREGHHTSLKKNQAIKRTHLQVQNIKGLGIARDHMVEYSVSMPDDAPRWRCQAIVQYYYNPLIDERE